MKTIPPTKPPAPAPEQPDPLRQYEHWLEIFGTWLGNSGYKTELAGVLNISKQSVTRYFVQRTHELPARLFLKALIWQEQKRSAPQRYWYKPIPGERFQQWTFRPSKA